jgi:hypothetical protein
MTDDSFMGRSRVYFSSAHKANRGRRCAPAVWPLSGRVVRAAYFFVMLADLAPTVAVP